jgi:uncharacterized RDD family membrane protein YckC
MSTAFNKIGIDRQLQDHWLRRLIAGIIDSIIISIVSWIISVLAAIPALFLGGAFIIGGFSFLHGILFFLYAAFLEYSHGATIGKQIMNLKVTTTEGNAASLDRTLIRNISKIHWILLLIDILIGMATVGDPRQKYSDRFAGTTVTSTISTNLLTPGGACCSSSSPPAPPTPPSSA